MHCLKMVFSCKIQIPISKHFAVLTFSAPEVEVYLLGVSPPWEFSLGLAVNRLNSTFFFFFLVILLQQRPNREYGDNQLEENPEKSVCTSPNRSPTRQHP